LSFVFLEFFDHVEAICVTGYKGGAAKEFCVFGHAVVLSEKATIVGGLFGGYALRVQVVSVF
jgi:hypothetical protein